MPSSGREHRVITDPSGEDDDGKKKIKKKIESLWSPYDIPGIHWIYSIPGPSSPHTTCLAPGFSLQKWPILKLHGK